ncbi:MAG TPA: CpsB/CapC family capsule biosynthesis tyrosine phosphatase [Gaiellaceae bacterium]|nr:CpsB/CapC family capsule biosynthesis tyrosine phosphatase [Gaiellaceae bacterium]
MIDLHSHVLPGLDDGASTLADALEMARAAASAGVTIVAGTPHVRHDYPTTPDEMEAALQEVQAAVAEEGIPVEVRGGGELDLEWLSAAPIEDVRRFGLAGNPSYALVEFPYAGWPLGIGEELFRLRVAGITPVLAHPERNPEVQARPERLRDLVEVGALVQVTAASLDGRLGSQPATAAVQLVRDGLVHLIASDAHSPAMRGFDLHAAAARVGEPGLAGWLVDDLPAAIASGSPLPQRPVPERRRSRGWPRRS